jgi:peptidoglycan/LPS O-acetylase OafA/YrhL
VQEQALNDLRRARRRTLASAAAVVALAVVAAAGVAISILTGADDAVALALVATIGAVCIAVWGGRVMRGIAHLEQRTTLRKGAHE